MDKFENKLLMSLDQGLTTDEIEKKFGIGENVLADTVIRLEDEGHIILKEKNWILTDKGKESLSKSREDELNKLNMRYVRGMVDKEEYAKMKAELSSPLSVDDEKNIENIYCPKCGTKNIMVHSYCRMCGTKLKKG